MNNKFYADIPLIIIATIFGLLVSDIGFGLIFLLLVIILIRILSQIKYKKLTLFNMYFAMTSIIFGFLFGEFFGDLAHRLHLLREVQIGTVILPLDNFIINPLSKISTVLLFLLLNIIFYIFLKLQIN